MAQVICASPQPGGESSQAKQLHCDDDGQNKPNRPDSKDERSPVPLVTRFAHRHVVPARAVRKEIRELVSENHGGENHGDQAGPAE